MKKFVFFLFLLLVIPISLGISFYEDFGSVEFTFNNSVCDLIPTQAERDGWATYGNVSAFHRGWKCVSTVADEDKVLLNYSNVPRASTNVGLYDWFGSTYYHSIAKNLNSFTLGQEDNITFYCSGFNEPTLSYPTGSRVFFEFGDDTNSYYRLQMSRNNRTQAVGETVCMLDEPYKNDCCNIYDLVDDCNSTTAVFKNLNVGDIFTHCGNSSILGDSYTMLEIGLIGSGGGFYIDDLGINYQNDLPSLDLGYNSKGCLNDTGTYTHIFNITSVDSEGDTIYYSVQEFYALQNYENYMFTFPNYDSMHAPFILTNETYQIRDTSLESFLWWNNVLSGTIVIKDFNGDKWLGVNPGTQDVIFKSETDLRNFTVVNFFLAMQNNTRVKVDYMGSNANSFKELEFNFTILSNLTIFEDSTLIYNSNFDNYDFVLNNVLQVVAYINGNDNFRLIIYDESMSVLVNESLTTTFTDFQYLRFDDLNSYTGDSHDAWFIDDISFVGLSISVLPLFSTSYDNTIEITEKGYYTYMISVTDTPHLSSTYISEEMFFSVVGDCSLMSDSPFGQGNISVDLFALGDAVFGDYLENYLNDLGLYNFGKNVIWWFFLGLTVFLIFGYFNFTRTFNILIPTMGSSLICFLIAFLVGYTMQWISLLMIFAFTISIPIARSFLGVSNE